ncbi:unnamed protein product [Tenebrio molitor]|nr:unnamed protein product [Tenebrio molitor]
MSLIMLCWFSLAMLFVIGFVEGRPQDQAEEEEFRCGSASFRGMKGGWWERVGGSKSG